MSAASSTGGHPEGGLVSWEPASGFSGTLGADSLHVWRQGLDETPGDANWLDELERRRAQAFRRDLDRSRFVSGRCFLRRVLGLYLRRHPAQFSLAADPRGKPFMAEPGAPHFNSSHSGSVGYVVVTRLGPVGVDVEVDHHVDDVHAVAESVLSTEEMAELARRAPISSAAFLRVWTRKEAVVKALGTGIASDLRALHVGVEPLDVTVAGPLGTMWVRTLDCVPGEHVAVALSRRPAEVRYYCLP